MPTYATAEELAAILKVSPTTQDDALTRVLVVASLEIDSEVDREDTDPLAGTELDLAAEVCLERAVEHWQQMKSPFGLVGLGDIGPAFTSRDSFERHALKLAPLKRQWGLA